MSTAAQLWFLPVTGVIAPVLLHSLKPLDAIRLWLGTDLVLPKSLAPGLDMWRSELESTQHHELNVPALQLVFGLIGREITTLPVICGPVVLSSHADEDLYQPVGLGLPGLQALRGFALGHQSCRVCDDHRSN